MTIALTTLPLEVLHAICECLDSHLDVASFRLVCQAFGNIGLKFLMPMVTVAPTAESIARLRAISLHPVLRHHVSGVTFLINVFYPDANYDDWLRRVPRPYKRNLGGLYGYWHRCWRIYEKLLSGQKNAFRALGPSQDVEDACRRLTSLDHLEIAESFCEEDYLQHNQTYKTLVKCHRYNVLEGQPFCPLSAASSYTGPPGVKPLKAFLRAMTSLKVRNLRVKVLDVGFFDGYETRGESYLRGGLYHLRALELQLCINDKSSEWCESIAAANRILSTNRLINFLCSAPHLEKIQVAFKWCAWETGYSHVKIANVLPRRHTWPHLRSLQIDSIEIIASHFLDFVSSHKSTLKLMSLRDCLLADDTDQGLEAPRSRWPDVFVPLVVSDPLDVLSLKGSFQISQENGDIDMLGFLQDFEITVGQAVAIAICSREFDSFLQDELAGHGGDLKAEAVKKALVEDLMGELQKPKGDGRSKVHAKRYSSYLKSFAMLRGNDPSWGAWWRRPGDCTILPDTHGTPSLRNPDLDPEE